MQEVSHMKLREVKEKRGYAGSSDGEKGNVLCKKLFSCCLALPLPDRGKEKGNTGNFAHDAQAGEGIMQEALPAFH